MNSFVLALLCLVTIATALPTPQAPAATPAPAPVVGPFMTMFQAAGAVAGAGFADAAKLAGIIPTAADSALGVGQTAFTRFFSGLTALASAGK